jgi:hypothetical protein
MAALVNRKSTVPASADTVLYGTNGSGGRTTDSGCTTFMVSVPSASPYGVIVHVAGLHAANVYVPVAVGQTVLFSYTTNGIVQVYAQGDGGTATNVAYGEVDKVMASL